MTTIDDPRHVLETAECIHDTAAVQAALDAMAGQIGAVLGEADPIVVCVLLGGIVPFSALLERLDFPLTIDYVHATRYRGGLAGGTVHWQARPSVDPRGRAILIVDDILDEGITLREIERYYAEAGAVSIHKAVLVDKQRPEGHVCSVDFAGVTVPDRYVFGCGMDYKGYWRNLNAVYAVGEQA